MTTKTFTAPAISCGHCTQTIEMELGEMAGISAVSANATTKEVSVTYDDPANWDGIKALMSEIGFPIQE